MTSAANSELELPVTFHTLSVVFAHVVRTCAGRRGRLRISAYNRPFEIFALF
jgi:hypothetical protein